MIAQAPSESVVELEQRLSDLRAQRGALDARLPALETVIAELRDLVGEVQEKLTAERSGTARAIGAAGGTVQLGTGYSDGGQIVHMTIGNETFTYGGPPPADSAEGRAEDAIRRVDALEQEAQPVLAALTRLEREHRDARRDVGLLGLEIEAVERQIVRVHQHEAERRELIGESLGWRQRLNQIMRRLSAA
jgi:chromosome segregation ATPase